MELNLSTQFNFILFSARIYPLLDVGLFQIRPRLSISSSPGPIPFCNILNIVSGACQCSVWSLLGAKLVSYVPTCGRPALPHDHLISISVVPQALEHLSL